ncbi:hypothetical protein DOO78_24640 [Roseicella frigidaeris]|uniref:Lipoprotein n=1 Tax=Roseicella frigidaeris TaxID=2230885 RepID=A0A327LZF0_9PROT|nr:hypothetical protein DOO78_24640 [Roseicella frigidaeris]
MRARTALLLAAAAALLAACAGPTDGMGRANPPPYAAGEGIATASSPSAGDPAASSGHEHHLQAGQPHVH